MSSINFEPITLERILETDNLLKALEKVVSNKGGAGVDGMKTERGGCRQKLRVNAIPCKPLLSPFWVGDADKKLDIYYSDCSLLSLLILKT